MQHLASRSPLLRAHTASGPPPCGCRADPNPDDGLGADAPGSRDGIPRIGVRAGTCPPYTSRSLVGPRAEEIGMVPMLRRALDPAGGGRGDAPVQPRAAVAAAQH